jgi:ankyrin repeat protein
LMLAAGNGHEQVALVLLEAKADPNMARSDGGTALMLAARYGHEQVALVLLEAKADPNKANSDGRTALMWAAQSGHEQVALVLLKAKADRNMELSGHYSGWNALKLAESGGHSAVCDLLR